MKVILKVRKARHCWSFMYNIYCLLHVLYQILTLCAVQCCNELHVLYQILTVCALLYCTVVNCVLNTRYLTYSTRSTGLHCC